MTNNCCESTAAAIGGSCRSNKVNIVYPSTAKRVTALAFLDSESYAALTTEKLADAIEIDQTFERRITVTGFNGKVSSVSFNIVSILIRFRQHSIVVTVDVKTAFNQLAVNKPDRDFLWLLVPKNWTKLLTTANIRAIRFRRLNFGVIFSPFLLSAVLRIYLGDNQSPIDEEIFRLVYVDNILLKGQCTEKVQKKLNLAKQRFPTISMDLRVELSSDRILNARWKVKTEESTFLGVRWDPDTDHLLFFFPTLQYKAQQR
uniref:Reverse transcriptase domain-containing protein n=1 Tax=Heterorhabditis bacteriophora TaxID=37862 RepID=A0A1I7XRC5_HETBA